MRPRYEGETANRASRGRRKRTLCPDGTLWEVVRLDKIGEDGEQPTEAELNRWIASIPIEPLRPWQGFIK